MCTSSSVLLTRREDGDDESDAIWRRRLMVMALISTLVLMSAPVTYVMAMIAMPMKGMVTIIVMHQFRGVMLLSDGATR